MDFVDSPFFVPALQGEASGVDFLGLRQVNLDLMDAFMPGINNVTDHVRPFSMLCWTVRAFQSALEREGTRTIRVGGKGDSFGAFRQKTEVLYNWSHQLMKAGKGLPGNAQRPPAGEGEIPLEFAKWRRKGSWLDAVNYGPALKDESGLGFVSSPKPKVYFLQEPGRALAQIFDAQIRGTKAYPRLTSLMPESASPQMAEAVFRHWSVLTPTPEEVAVFTKAFFRPDEAGKHGATAERASSILLILAALAGASSPLDVWSLRYAIMTLPVRATNEALLRQMLQQQAHWRVLQLRQLQRYALEAIFSWLERKVFEGYSTVRALARAGCESIAAEKGEPFAKSLAPFVADFDRLRGRERTLLAAGRVRDGANLFSLWSGLETVANDKIATQRIVPLALEALCFCASLTEELGREEIHRRDLRRGGRDRVSLELGRELIERYRTESLEAFLVEVLESYVLSQHFRYALLRNEQDKPRLRVALEEEGLVCLVGDKKRGSPPPVTEDRLKSALALLSECGFVHVRGVADDAKYQLTPVGRQAVRRYALL